MQNKYFIGYAKESFDGTPLSYGVDVCDNPDDHIVDVSDPGLYVDIQITGRLDNPIDLAELNGFLQRHNLSMNSLNQSKEQTFASEESINAAFEAEAAATETGFMDAIRNTHAGLSVKSSQNALKNLESSWGANLENLQDCTLHMRFKKSAITDVEAARYLAAKCEDAVVSKIFVCYQTRGKKGDGIREYGEVAQEMKPEWQGTDEEKKAIVRILKNLRSFCKPGEVVGYTLKKEDAESWKNSLKEDGVSDEAGSDTDDISIGGTSIAKTQFEESWAKAKDPLSRAKLLVRYLGDKRERIDDNIIRDMATISALKTSWSWQALQYVLGSDDMKFLSSVYAAIKNDRNLRETLLSYTTGFKGLDFGNTTQFAVIKAAIGTADLAKLYDKKSGWKSIDDMKKIYKEKNAFRNSPPEGAAATRRTRRGQSVDTIADNISGLNEEQIAQMIRTLSDTPEGNRALQNILGSIGGGAGSRSGR